MISSVTSNHYCGNYVEFNRCGEDARNGRPAYSRNVKFRERGGLLIGEHFHSQKFKNVNWTADLSGMTISNLILIGRPEIGTWDIKLKRVSTGVFEGGVYANTGIQTRSCRLEINASAIKPVDRIIEKMVLAERNRREAETNREKSEANRNKNEKKRSEAESRRDKSEKEKRVAEEKRISQEKKREEAESDRKARDLDRDKKIRSTEKKLTEAEKRIEALENETGVKFSQLDLLQQQFCNISDEWIDKLQKAQSTGNQLKIKKINREREVDYRALLKEGKFEKWVVKAENIYALPNGAAWVVVTMPCRAILATDVCSATKAEIKEGTFAYRELEKISIGDKLAITGSIVFANKDENSWYPDGSFCRTISNPRKYDVFGIKLESIVKMSR